jgi:glutathione S-transferase
MSVPLFRLHHHPLDPPSRRVRLTLAEKGVTFDTVQERPWDPRPEFLMVSPAGGVPVLAIETEEEPLTLGGANAICEYLEETEGAPNLLGKTAERRAEVRRLVDWFEGRMYAEVTSHLLEEKAFKRLAGAGEPDSARIRVGYHNIHGHLAYIGWLIERRNWLAGDDMTFADLAAAAQLSTIDYLGDVPWAKHPIAKDWYARLKSRPSFRPILGDHLAGLLPPRHYADLDF